MAAPILSSLANAVTTAATPDRAAARAEARQLKAEREEQLRQLQATAPSQETLDTQKDVAAQEIQLLQQRNKQLLQNVVKTETFSALDRFSADHDARHLTTLVQDMRRQRLPLGFLEDVARMDNLSELDRAELDKMGFDADLVLNSPEAKAALVRVTNTDGSVAIKSVDRLKAATGYQRYASSRELEELRKRAEIANLLRKGSATAGTAAEREAARVMAEKYPNLQEGSPEYQAAYNDEFQAIVDRGLQSSVSRNLDEVDQTRDTIDKLAREQFGKDYFEISMADPKARRTFERHIERMETLGKLNLSESEKKKIGQIKQLIAVGNIGSNISSEETGIIDKFSNDVKKYVTDKVSGVEATSAYSAYRNILRNALYGSVLTEAEMQAFKDQFGDLKQQTGPVLVQFKTALTQLQGELQALLDTNNSHVMHFRLGKDKEELQNIIDGLQQRIEFFSSIESGEPSTVTPPPAKTGPSLTEEDLQGLDAIAAEVTL